MAEWFQTLDITKAWKQATEGSISYADLSEVIAGKLNDLPDIADEAIDSGKNALITSFEAAGHEEDLTANQLDEILAQLYDWADLPVQTRAGVASRRVRCCWVVR